MVELQVTAGYKRVGVAAKEQLGSCVMMIFPGVELIEIVSMSWV